MSGWAGAMPFWNNDKGSKRKHSNLVNSCINTNWWLNNKPSDLNHAVFFTAYVQFGLTTYNLVGAACSAKLSIPPDAPLAKAEGAPFCETRVQVTNETTLGASLRFVESGLRPVALNFANGLHPGGGFLNGARAQEEVLCRSSALYQTLVNDQMYEEHRRRRRPDSTDWAIYSPAVPIFRKDEGAEVDHPCLLSFITCAAPYAPSIGQPEAGDLLQKRIHRVLAITQAFGYSTLVLGAWGCGAFGNDIHRTAVDFREALVIDFRGAFSDIVFAITDWSPERKFLGPFRDAFNS